MIVSGEHRMSSQPVPGIWGKAQRVTWQQDQEDERSYWADKTIPERLAAMVELNQRSFSLNDPELNDGPAARLVRRPRRG